MSIELSGNIAPRPLFARLTDRFRNAVIRWTELQCLESGEGDAIAHELNLSKAELMALVHTRAGAVESLSKRLSNAGLSEQALAASHRETLRDMRRVCSLCPVQPRCIRDLKHERRAAPAKYCPNEETLRALVREKQQKFRILPFPAARN